jgi:hypothetical protein
MERHSPAGIIPGFPTSLSDASTISDLLDQIEGPGLNDRRRGQRPEMDEPEA